MESSQTASPKKQLPFTRRQGVQLILSLLALAALAMWIGAQTDVPGRDYFTFFLSGKLLQLHLSPYAETAWLGGHDFYQSLYRPNPVFPYPLPLAVFFIPFAWLPIQTSFIVWIFLTGLAIFASAGLILQPLQRAERRRYLFPLLCGLILFRPVIVIMQGGQLDGVLLLLYSLAAFAWQRERWSLGAVLITLPILKPNIGVPVAALIALWLLLRRAYRPLIAMSLTALLLAAFGWLVDPHWIAEFVQISTTKLAGIFGYAPNLWGAANHLCGFQTGCARSLGAVLSGLILLGTVLWLARLPKEQAFLALSLAICATLLVTVYLWTYDQLLLLLPLLWIIRELIRRKSRFLLPATLLLWVDLAYILLMLITLRMQMEIWNVLLPLAVLIVLGAITFRVKSVQGKEDDQSNPAAG